MEGERVDGALKEFDFDRLTSHQEGILDQSAEAINAGAGAGAGGSGRGSEGKGQPYDVRLQAPSTAQDPQLTLQSPAVLAVIGLLLFVALLLLALLVPRLFGHKRVVDKKKKVAHIV